MGSVWFARMISEQQALINPVWDASMESATSPYTESCMGSVWFARMVSEQQALINPVWDLYGLPVWNLQQALMSPVWDLYRYVQEPITYLPI